MAGFGEDLTGRSADKMNDGVVRLLLNGCQCLIRINHIHNTKVGGCLQQKEASFTGLFEAESKKQNCKPLTVKCFTR